MMPSIGPDDILAELGPLRRYARTLARGGEEAEDLAQTALVRSLERRDGFRRTLTRTFDL
jgi:RNA polymerase sigma-70 factor (ECF subfamily)